MVNLTEVGPVASMTAFAGAESAANGMSWSWEMRGVNGRGLDIRLRLPDGLGALEQPLRAAVGRAVVRGNVTVNLRLGRSGTESGARLDGRALAAVLSALAEVEAAADAQGLTLVQTNAAQILGLRGVMEGGDGASLPTAEVMLPEAEALVAAFVAMRQSEGAALRVVMEGQLTRIAELAEAAAKAAAARIASQGDGLREAVARVLETTDAVDEARLAQEIALLAVKADVTEEIDRLRAHVAAARDLLAKGGPVGRKLDFLMQEFNREANTMCSKSSDSALTAIGLDLKLTIDQMREQVQNVE